MGDGSLRVVRNGIGINETASVELLGIKVCVKGVCVKGVCAKES
jgi:hypothetical protein